MSNDFTQLQDLLNKRSDLQARLKLLPYDGTPEIKQRGERKFLYIRKRESGKLTSTYVGAYTDELYNILLRNNAQAREIKKSLRQIDKQLSRLDYSIDELSPRVIQNIDFARANMKMNIYDQAILEGVATSIPQTSEIIDNGIINGMTTSDVQKILNLKHAWEFILDRNVVASKTDYYLLSHIARIINEGFYLEGGRLRSVPVTIGGTKYIPPLPNEITVKEKINEILYKDIENIDKAIELCMYLMKTQVFLDGNKRASIIFVNHYLLSHGAGLIVIPASEVQTFRKILVNYYEGEDFSIVHKFMKEKCWKKF